MSTKSNIPEGLSEADLELLINNPGQTISGTVGGSPTAIRASSSVDISNPQRKGIRPNIPGSSHDPTEGRISKPSSGLAGRLAEGDAKRRALEEARRVEREALLRETDPLALAKQVAYLTRQLKKLTTEVNKLKKESQP